MKLPPLSRQQVREIDEIAINEFGMNGLVLMENAGRGAAKIVDSVSPQDAPIVILCGKGNNGGDGYVIARHLELAGRDVSIISLVPLTELTGDAEHNAGIAHKSGIKIFEIESIDTDPIPLVGSAGAIVDCMLGTGARGKLRKPMTQYCQSANTTGALRIAIDVPTGFDCQTGDADPTAFLADHTITFVSTKIGFETANSGRYLGTKHIVPIGVPKVLLNRYEATPLS